MRVVMKFGGTSVGSVDRIRNVAKRCVRRQAEGHEVAVVVSAMSGETNRLVSLTKEFTSDPNDRECDVVLSTGEQVSIGLLALAIREIGGKAKSFLGHQVKILTDDAFSRARISNVDGAALTECLSNDTIAVVAGFQGVTDSGDISTLGRGGSDTTAVAIAASVNADVCEIYTDVDGVYTTDPNVVPEARKIDKITYEEMLELASLGAKVLQIRAVEFAMNYNVPLHVRSSFNDNPGTMVVAAGENMESVVVSGVTAVTSESKVTIKRVPDVAGNVAKIFKPLADGGIVVDMIVQNVSENGETAVTFTVPTDDLARAEAVLQREAPDIATESNIRTDQNVAKVSIVGVGMRSHAGVAQRMFQILADEGINIQLISTSEIKVSCLIEKKYAELATRALHAGFKLESE